MHKYGRRTRGADQSRLGLFQVRAPFNNASSIIQSMRVSDDVTAWIACRSSVFTSVV